MSCGGRAGKRVRAINFTVISQWLRRWPKCFVPIAKSRNIKPKQKWADHSNSKNIILVSKYEVCTSVISSLYASSWINDNSTDNKGHSVSSGYSELTNLCKGLQFFSSEVLIRPTISTTTEPLSVLVLTTSPPCFSLCGDKPKERRKRLRGIRRPIQLEASPVEGQQLQQKDTKRRKRPKSQNKLISAHA